MKPENLICDDDSTAYTFGRLDAALGDEPTRFSDPKVFGPDADQAQCRNLRERYLHGFEEMKKRIDEPAIIKREFRNEYSHRFATQPKINLQ